MPDLAKSAAGITYTGIHNAGTRYCMLSVSMEELAEAFKIRPLINLITGGRLT
jgi:hypothetical protein